MEIQANGICIGARVRGESDKMLTVFCEDGKIYDVLARGALKPKYKLKFASQLFSACDYYLCPSRAGYYILGGATFGALSFMRIASDPDAFAAACFVCEAACKCVHGENKRLYAETMAALGELANFEDCKPAYVCLRMLAAALSDSGYGLAGNGNGVCEKFLAAQAGNASGVDSTDGEVFRVIRAQGARFASVFGKPNSLAMVLAQEKAK